jgi:LysR family hydrogen peroxide-inducible transcriptional activator
MNLRDLDYLVAVARTRHFGRAAELCFVSQPTLSGQIKKLEQELGVTLFERTNRSVETTVLGEAVVEQARRVLEQVDVLKQLAQAHKDPLVGPLRVGAIPTLSPYLVPLILKPLKKQYPNTRLVLSEELTDSLLVRLANHEIDAALLATPVADSELDAIPLFDEPFWLVCPRAHPLASKKKVVHRDLSGADLLLLSEGHCLAEQAMEVCRLQDRSAQGDLADLRAASLETLLQLVVAGFGCTLLPALALKSEWTRNRSVSARRLGLSDTYRRVSLVYRRTYPRRRALQAFAEVVLNSLPDSVQRLNPGF